MATNLEVFSDLVQNIRWDIDDMSKDELYHSFSEIDNKMNIIYKFVLGYNDYINMRHNYTSEVDLTMLEAHVLTNICDHPGSTVTGLANTWSRSVSATSQTVRKLMNKGLVIRENAPDNGKIFYLYPTEKGVRASDQHKRYDVEDTIKTIKCLLKKMPFEDILTMFNALDCYASLLRKETQK